MNLFKIIFLLSALINTSLNTSSAMENDQKYDYLSSITQVQTETCYASLDINFKKLNCDMDGYATISDNPCYTWEKLLKIATPTSVEDDTAQTILKNASLYINKHVLGNLYNELHWLGEGGEARIYKISLKEDRPEFGLKRGEHIALRCIFACLNKKLENYNYNPYHTFLPLRVSKIDKSVTGYFPEYYGFYYSNQLFPKYKSMPIQPVYSTENLLDFEERIFQCFEMQLVDTDFEEAYVPEPKAYREYIPPKSIPDSVFFEFVYGEWVCKNLANLYIHDLKLRNIGLKKVDLKRFYHFGEVTYCFEPGFMPMRLDLNAFDELELKDNYNKNNLTVQIKFIQRFLAPKSMAEEFSREYLNDPEKGIFFYFERYFKGSQVKVSCDALGIHYYKPEV